MGLNWLDSIDHLKGVGPARVKLFQQVGVSTVRDLMFHFPFRFESVAVRLLATILDQEKVTLKGKVVTPPVVAYFGGKKSRVSFKLAVNDHEIINVSFFNQPYLKQAIQLGQERAIYGKWQSNRQTLLGMKLIQVAQEGQDFAPVYHATKGLKQSAIVASIAASFNQYQEAIPEVLPQHLNDQYRLLDLPLALYAMHFPADQEQHHQATRKIIYQEFFLYQWRLQAALKQHETEPGIQIHYDNDQLKTWISHLPYELTQAQKQVVNEICRDLMAQHPMRRMVQGDVGSGKTLVAFLAILASLSGGFQSALMAPTEILAKQHAQSFNQLFASMGMEAALLTSAMTAKAKQAVLDGLANGQIQVVIGTHALIQETVQFKQLGLVIIDEQHRFGVGQRQALVDKNDKIAVNLLQMTATPIPRSLAMTLYGEMHVSTIDQLPKGRQPITTHWLKEDQLEELEDHVAQELEAGHQVYYVLPLIESSEHLEQIENVLEVAERLADRFPNFKVDVLHGQLNKEEQEAVMDRFKQNQVQILVATTMVEVGVDVPNATIMVIQSAERFGLAQLHQLRGRVGRSQLASYCYLIGSPTTEQGKERLKIMVDHQDGFLISREDLKIRGMGDLMGSSQSGLPEFHYANLIEDEKILTVARKDVQDLLKHPERLSEAEWQALNQWSQTQAIEV